MIRTIMAIAFKYFKYGYKYVPHYVLRCPDIA